MDEKITLSRSRFLQLGAKVALGIAGILGAGGLVRYFSHLPAAETPAQYDLGLAVDFPASGKLIRLDIPSVIYRSPDGFRAYSLVCTHLGCTLEEKGNDFSCPCHGSQFDPDGRVVQGPAVDRLPTLKVGVAEDGRLILTTGEGN
jgi:cytochrome b6-f complex iron-sulfur subunit